MDLGSLQFLSYEFAKKVKEDKNIFEITYSVHTEYVVDGVVIPIVKVPQQPQPKWNSKPSWGWLGISHFSSFVSLIPLFNI